MRVCRGELEVGSDAVGSNGQVADAYLSVRGWTMGLAFVNGFNLGWYWPSRGPANTMCAPCHSKLHEVRGTYRHVSATHL